MRVDIKYLAFVEQTKSAIFSCCLIEFLSFVLHLCTSNSITLILAKRSKTGWKILSRF